MKTLRWSGLVILSVAFILLFPMTVLAVPEAIVADAPENTPAGRTFRPAYLQQLGSLRERQSQKISLAATFEHRVAKGETLGSIARKYGTSVNYLMQANGLRNPHFIREGQVLTLVAEHTAVQPEAAVARVTHRLQRGETVWDLARRYRVSADDILLANNIKDPTRLMPGRELLILGANAGAHMTPVSAGQREIVIASRFAARNNPDFIWPAPGYISSGYGPRWGRFHNGIDIAANTGTRIVAAAAGIVTDAGWRRGYGYMVRIDHQNGWASVYGHCSRLFVREGQSVNVGQHIANVGQTGNATGPHVHLELIYQGKHQNPIKYLPSR